MTCRQAVALASDYLDGALSRRDRRRLERHLAKCDGCSEYLAQLRAAVRATGQVEPDELDPATLEGLVGLYEQFKSDDESGT
jgi:anti-sigma factor RsiW